jgi:hypothetical protein
MALPQLNDTPRYDMTIPSSGKTIRYRPYLVREEKTLLVASQSEDINQIMKTIVDTIVTCTNGEVKANELTTFDIEYMFLQIRSKSVGETAELGLICQECSHTNKVDVKIDDVTCEGAKPQKPIALTDTIKLEMKYPSYNSISYTDDETELGFQIMQQCIKAVITPDERFDLADETPENVRAFLESMTGEQFSKITDFVETLPQLRKDVNFTCSKCGHNNEIQLKGMRDFF